LRVLGNRVLRRIFGCKREEVLEAGEDCIMRGYSLDDRGSIPGRSWEFFSSPPCPDRLWSPPGPLSNRYRGKAAGNLKLTTYLHLAQRLRMRGSITPLPQYVFMAWCLVKHRDNFTFSKFIIFKQCC
jgi:hypothetical protein